MMKFKQLRPGVKGLIVLLPLLGCLLGGLLYWRHRIGPSGTTGPLPPSLIRTWKVPEDSFAQFNLVSINRKGSIVAATGGSDGVNWVRVWSIKTGRLLRRWQGSTSLDEIRSIAFAPDGQTLAIADDKVRLWHIPTGNTLKSRRADTSAWAFSPDGRTLAFATQRSIALWDLARNRLQPNLKGDSASVNLIAFSPDGRLLASVGRDDGVTVWNVRTGRLIGRRRLHEGSSLDCAFVKSSTGRPVVTSINERGVQALWDVRSGHIKKVSTGHDYHVNPDAWPVSHAGFSSDGARFGLSAWTTGLFEDATGYAEVWSSAAGRKVFEVAGGGKWGDMALSDNGYVAISSGEQVRVWKLR